MMRHGIAFGIKLIISSIVILSLFGIFYNASIPSLIFMSIVIAGVGYIIGDLLILKRFGNVIASLADFVLHFATIWALTGMFLGASTALTITSVAAAYIITVTEPLFHAYMIERVFEDKEEKGVVIPIRYQTEFSEEHDLEDEKIKTENKTDQNGLDQDNKE